MGLGHQERLLGNEFSGSPGFVYNELVYRLHKNLAHELTLNEDAMASSHSPSFRSEHLP